MQTSTKYAHGKVSRIDINHGQVVLHAADCRTVLAGLADNSVDSCVCDPPYALVSVTKRFGKDGAAPAKHGTDGLYARASAGFMGKQWDTGEVAFAEEFWADVLRVLKPGGHVVAFGGTRTYHRLACAIEDAGFEIRDALMWHYGQGFPKSHNQGDGWGTALKPATEIIAFGRKPIVGTVAANREVWGTGAINIEGCRVPVTGADAGQLRVMSRSLREGGDGWGMSTVSGDTPQVVRPEGRWPANLLHDGSDEVLAAFPQAPGQQGDLNGQSKGRKSRGIFGDMPAERLAAARIETDKSAARFFYCAKASKADREEGLDGLPKGKAGMLSETSGQHITRRDDGYVVAPRANTHPTVKPTDVMRWLVRLVTPKGGVVLDPFMGSGSTGKAAMLEGMRFIGVEREAEYMPIAEGRITWAVREEEATAKPVAANDDIVSWIEAQAVA